MTAEHVESSSAPSNELPTSDPAVEAPAEAASDAPRIELPPSDQNGAPAATITIVVTPTEEPGKVGITWNSSNPDLMWQLMMLRQVSDNVFNRILAMKREELAQPVAPSPIHIPNRAERRQLERTGRR